MGDAPRSEDLNRWAAARDDAALYLNATAVALDGAGVVILGAPGTGKSTLALSLMAFGAGLIADDGIWVAARAGRIDVDRPANAVDLIEARGIGLLKAGPIAATAPAALVIDLDRAEDQRLPPARAVTLDGVEAPLILAKGAPHLSITIRHLLRHGRAAP
jgi:HPr kinase/phosphorylase